ncbi:hypothetical protein VFPFJ_07682 [Purpureocillium lilacinum]|uniref:Uncharacterized protein n=1 Tax=Purpureocillium lilacinum TaxID=33203 RepID=A0A179H6W3_PURLI|nr:hypothetical protein VFPFJ_07682 [Purpureocillium lilacinum]OAQ85293.1 hypothetical protein VFPFJ_07682 [Purpureocillium lilacinum]
MPGMRNEKNLRVQRSYHPNSATGNVRDPDVRDFLPWAKSGYAHAVLWSVRCSAVISPVCLLFSPPTIWGDAVETDRRSCHRVSSSTKGPRYGEPSTSPVTPYFGDPVRRRLVVRRLGLARLARAP